MKSLIVNSSDNFGGAGRAAYRIHDALLKNDVFSEMWVTLKITDDPKVLSFDGRIDKLSKLLRPHIAALMIRKVVPSRKDLLSPAIFPSKWPERINNSDFDIVNLHWINGEMLSISDISKIEKPIVWTLHDMWLFCGAEHYASNDRWKTGYLNENSGHKGSRFDMDRLIWKRKSKYWKREFQIVTPSNWLANCVRESPLFRNWGVNVIHNPIDKDKWYPIDKHIARKLLNLPPEKPLVLFCVFGGIEDPRKGFDLLNESLLHLREIVKDVEMVVIGQSRFNTIKTVINTHFFGQLNDDISLMLLYNAVDVLVLPSRLDNLPNVAVEAQACGTPVVAFNTGGLPDLIQHGIDGYLAETFSTEDFASGIAWLLSSKDVQEETSTQAREKVVNKFSSHIIGKKYADLFTKAVEQHNSTT